MANHKSFLYFADPMCSWCWGFFPVIEQVNKDFADQVNLIIHVGGLRAGNTQVMDVTQRNYILGHWHHVHERSGQPFNFDFSVPEGFIYDTEPACRAVKVVEQLAPDKTLIYLHTIQSAFYVENQDITQTDTLTQRAQTLGINKKAFHQLFISESARQLANRDFHLTQRMGVNGFPCLIGYVAESSYTYLSQGYQDYSTLKPTILNWLQDTG